MGEEGARKGPWTEYEDAQLALHVNLFGDRRWDFVAKVSGLKRTGKSCRLRWVNYLRPGLKRGKMSPEEEQLIHELHRRWGNRWSRIAHELPGRTDNEIKNFWRAHLRKVAQEAKKDIIISSSPSSNIAHVGDLDAAPPATTEETTSSAEVEKTIEVPSMDEVWREIELCEGSDSLMSHKMTTASDLCSVETVWSMEETYEDTNMLLDQMIAHFQYPF